MEREAVKEKFNKFRKYASAFAEAEVNKNYWLREQEMLERNNKTIKSELNSISMTNQKFHRVFSL